MRDYDSTVARIAGNLLSGAVRGDHYAALGRHGMDFEDDAMVRGAVLVAQAIVTETKRTEPREDRGAGHDLAEENKRLKQTIETLEMNLRHHGDGIP